MKSKKIVIVFLFCFFSVNLIGCESFTRKFTRKSKKTDQVVEMVLTPEEYKGPDLSKEQLYRQYFLFWKSWQDELISALTYNGSLKKKIDCAKEALKNLINMRTLFAATAQNNFDPYIARSNNLISDMQSDTYGSNNSRNIQVAQHLKSDIQRGFIYPKIRNYLR